MRLLFLLQVLKSEVKNNYFLVKSFVFSLFFTLLAISLVNYKSYLSFATADYSIFPKLQILAYIFLGSFLSLDLVDKILLIFTAFLFGINMELVFRKIAFLSSQKSVGFTLGASIISLAATGCASCGLSIVSLVGLAGVIALLPFHGLELYILSIIILIVSLFYNLQTLVKVCKIR